jgi:hypothetical protein
VDKSNKFSFMLRKASLKHPEDFKSFDDTKNVQDQLLEIIKKHIDKKAQATSDIKTHPLNHLSYFCHWFSKKVPWNKVSQFTSPEQVLLAFIMKEQFGQAWDDEKVSWIKSE